MSYQVLARKWRPRSFSELVGQEHVVQALSNALDQQRLHHAYLFTGTRGVGKTTLGRILAKALNCETGITSHPCGKCAACQEIDRGRFVDLLELDAASNTGIDNMREVLDNAQYAPTSGRFKVYLIDEVHMLSKAAFNSMLKTLEEPPEHVKFILATTDPQKIPVTVLSRCLQFNLKQMSAPAIVDHLQRILGKENISFEGGALPLLARAAQGSMRDALSLTDQAIAHGSGKIGEADVLAMLGAVDQTYLFEILEHLAGGEGPAMIATAERMAERSISFDAALQDMGIILHHLALAQTVPDALGNDLPERSRILDLANRFTPEDVQLYYQIVIHARKDLYLAPDEFAGFTMALIRMLAFSLEAGKSATPVNSVQTKPVSQVVPSSPKSELVVSEPAAESGSKKNSFNGEWSDLVNRLKLSGMAKMLAQHCGLRSFANNQVELCVPEAHRHLAEKPYQEKLRTALEDYLGTPVKVAIQVGAVTGMTPVEIQNRDREAKQAQAVAAIETDPFVRELVENFDAKIIDSSIKPIQ